MIFHIEAGCGGAGKQGCRWDDMQVMAFKMANLWLFALSHEDILLYAGCLYVCGSWLLSMVAVVAIFGG